MLHCHRTGRRPLLPRNFRPRGLIGRAEDDDEKPKTPSRNPDLIARPTLHRRYGGAARLQEGRLGGGGGVVRLRRRLRRAAQVPGSLLRPHARLRRDLRRRCERLQHPLPRPPAGDGRLRW